jgi:cyclopropane fatty-acyl-phospholipid synthase-like methyltransferase
MENKNALDYFKTTAKDPNINNRSCKVGSINDHTQLDADFIVQYANFNTRILDLGSGTGLIVNKLYDKVGSITCVEPFKEFTQFIEKSGNISIFNQTIMDFNSADAFDLVTIFGVMQYFSEQEAVEIYAKYYPYLKERGKLIVKNQLGVSEDVIVEGYSEEQKTDYFSHYRHIGKEQKIIETIGYKNVEVHDIYPPECNRWDNTHFYAIVAEK